MAPLNCLSGNLSTFNLIDRLNQKEETNDCLIRIPLESTAPFTEESIHPRNDNSDLKAFHNSVSTKTEENLSDLSAEKYLVSPVCQTEKEEKPKTKKYNSKKDFDCAKYIQEERRKLMKRLENSSDDRIIFKKRVKTQRNNSKKNEESYRGSRYWGVSKNKSKWQVMITLNYYKEYKGGFSSDHEAAKVYDRISICTYGLKAKTNNDYSKRQVLEILQNDESIVL